MHQSAFKKRPLATAIHLLLAVSCGTAVITGNTVHAQSAQTGQQAATYQVDIPAGPLTAALNTFANEVGIALSFDPRLAAGVGSEGIKGRYSVQQGFAELLRGSGLALEQKSDRTYSLKRAPVTSVSQVEATLPAVTVNAGNEETTEGTGSYTTGAMRTATKLALSIRETPQSVTVITSQMMEDRKIDDFDTLMNTVAGVRASKGVQDARSSYWFRGFFVDSYQMDGCPPTPTLSTTTTPTNSTGSKSSRVPLV